MCESHNTTPMIMNNEEIKCEDITLFVISSSVQIGFFAFFDFSSINSTNRTYNHQKHQATATVLTMLKAIAATYELHHDIANELIIKALLVELDYQIFYTRCHA